MARELPAADMESRLRAAWPLPADTWRELALRRSLAVRDALVARGLPPDRLFVGSPKPREPGDTAWHPQVHLSLATP
jgi:hypothetical protein